MTIRVFVNEIFRGDFADRSEPLRAPRRHINKIAGGDRIPGVAQAVNAAAFEHQEAMLHNVHFNHAERGSRLVDHGVHGEVELHGIGKEAFYLEAGVVIQRLCSDGIFARNDCARRFDGGERLITFSKTAARLARAATTRCGAPSGK